VALVLWLLAASALLGFIIPSEAVVKFAGGALLLITAYFTAGSRRDTRASKNLDQLLAIAEHLRSGDPVVRCAAEQVLLHLEDDDEASAAAKAVRAAHDARSNSQSPADASPP
jgi:Flp pilus assembly protein TadB